MTNKTHSNRSGVSEAETLEALFVSVLNDVGFPPAGSPAAARAEALVTRLRSVETPMTVDLRNKAIALELRVREAVERGDAAQIVEDLRVRMLRARREADASESITAYD